MTSVGGAVVTGGTVVTVVGCSLSFLTVVSVGGTVLSEGTVCVGVTASLLSSVAGVVTPVGFVWCLSVVSCHVASKAEGFVSVGSVNVFSERQPIRKTRQMASGIKSSCFIIITICLFMLNFVQQVHKVKPVSVSSGMYEGTHGIAVLPLYYSEGYPHSP